MTNIDAVRDRLGPLGVWLSTLGSAPATVEREAAAEIEALGYGSLWIGEAPAFKEPFAHAAILLGATSSLVVGTGIASIYARDAVAMRAGAQTTGEAHPGRFVLGLGVSHAPLVQTRGHHYGKPVTAMREYLDAMDATQYAGPAPDPAVPVVLAALRPRMLELARDRTDGAHPYFVPVAHTERARAALGPDRLLIPEQMVLVETDPDVARAAARTAMALYLQLPNYTDNLLTLGYTEADIADGGSDRLVDDIVAWGTVDDVHARVQAHLDAGADHVTIQPLGPVDAARAQLRQLAPRG
jgi:probable F420-dependent oxidoreductase